MTLKVLYVIYNQRVQLISPPMIHLPICELGLAKIIGCGDSTLVVGPHFAKQCKMGSPFHISEIMGSS